MMLDFPGSLLKVLAPEKAYLLGETTQVCMMCLDLRGARLLVAPAAEPSAEVDELANRCGEILA
ncbi:MAG: hypothetical protein ABSF03_13560 [Streptosporangiaceae bacterium]